MNNKKFGIKASARFPVSEYNKVLDDMYRELKTIKEVKLYK